MRRMKSSAALVCAVSMLVTACASPAAMDTDTTGTAVQTESSGQTGAGNQIEAAGQENRKTGGRFTSLSQEERIKSTYNPAYMGAGVDGYGNPVVVGTADQGQVANQVMIDHHKQFVPKLYKITDRVYATNGFGLANSVMIEGDDGIIIIDTNDSIEAAGKELEQYRTITDKPVKAVIYSHFHYTGGTMAYVPEGNPDNIPIIAHEDLVSCMSSVLSEYSTVYVDRLMRHHGGYLSFEGEDGLVGCGLGPFYANPEIEHPTSGFMPPNTSIPKGKVTEMTIEGIRFQFIPQPSDSEDSMIIWMPDEKVCVNNLAWPTFPNLYTLRGEPYRDPRIWMNGVDKIIALEPEHLVTVHGLPMSGRDTIKEELTNYRDGIQFLFDQTVRYMNKGYSPDQIVEAVRVPERLASGKISKETYGEIDYHIRGIYGGLIGWFGTDTTELHPVTPEFEAEKIIEGFGGRDVVMSQAKAVLDDKQYAWAAQLITYVLTIEPDNEEARQIKADALRSMAQVAPATTTRHFYLCQALELEGKLDKSAAASTLTKDKLMGAPRDSILNIMRASIDPEKCWDMEKTLQFNFTDEGLSYGLIVRNGVGQVVENPAQADVVIDIPYETLVEVLLKKKVLDDCIQSGEVVINNPELFQTMFSIFDLPI